MKQFTKLTEIEILNAAWIYYLNRQLEEEELYRQTPLSELAKYRYEEEKAKADEIHDELVRLENSIHQ